MSVEYSREQAEQVLKDENKFNGFNTILFTGDKKFLNHKFPPKIEYVGSVWKIENRIFLCNSQTESGTLHGYGIDDDGKWFLTSGAGFCCCSASSLHKLTQATPTEWMDALDKFAESKYNVGDKVESLVVPGVRTVLQTINSPKRNKLQMNQYWGLATKTATGVLLMDDGIWADIITPAKDELNEKLEELTKLAESQGKNLKITFEKQ